MRKSVMFKKAHELAKVINNKVDNYSIAFSISLKKIWKLVKAGRKVITTATIKNASYELTHINYEEQALKGFNYYNSGKYMVFNNQVANNDKVIVKVADEMLYGFISKFNNRRTYMLKLDAHHMVYLKDFQVFNGFYGTYVILDRKYWNVKKASKSFDDMIESADLSFDKEVEIAKDQQAAADDIRVGRMTTTTINGSRDYRWSFC